MLHSFTGVGAGEGQRKQKPGTKLLALSQWGHLIPSPCFRSRGHVSDQAKTQKFGDLASGDLVEGASHPGACLDSSVVLALRPLPLDILGTR
jgi:hypothetical protein